jgi:membrane-bound lytic murein transglycosylase B
MLPKQAGAKPPPFEQRIAAFRSKATARGITEETYTRVMQGVRPDPTALDAIRDQPEFNSQAQSRHHSG